MALSMVCVFGVTSSAANTPYRPYDLVVNDSGISLKIDAESNSYSQNNPYRFACSRFDMFMIATDSPTGLDAGSNFAYEYVIVVRNDGYPTATDGAGVTKDGLTFNITLNTSAINKIKDFSAENPYVWLVIRPCSQENGLDNAYTENQNTLGFYNNKAAARAYFDSAVCLGKYNSLDDFHDIKPASTLTLGDFDTATKTFSKAEGTGTAKFGCVAIYIANTVSANDKVTLPAGYTKSAKSDDYKIYVNLSEPATAGEIAKDLISKVAFNFEAENSVRFELLPNEPDEAYFYNEDTQHYYTFVNDETSTWVECYEAAKNMQYNGRQGYLATVTSKEEDIFVYNASGNKVGWLGSSRLMPAGKDGNYYNSFSTTEFTTNWCWSCGPEIGTEFFDTKDVRDEFGDNRNSAVVNAIFARNDEKNYYFNWGFGEPSAGDNENALTTLMTGAGHSTGSELGNYAWNDILYDRDGGKLIGSGWNPSGYLVEFGDLTVGDSNTAVNPTGDGLITLPKADRILSVTEQTTPVVGQYVTLEVLVSKPAAKIQFVNSSKGTVTYHEGSDRVYSITENADGTQTWVIKLMVYKLSEPYTVLPKFGKVWTAEGSYDYTLNDNHKYEGTVYSVTVPDATDNKVTVGRHDVIIETNLDVAKVQFAYLGTTATFSPNSAVSVEEKDGHLFWTCNFNFCKKGTAMNFDINTRTKVTSFEYSGVSLVIDVTK